MSCVASFQPLAATMAATVVPFLVAMRDNVSPSTTVYVPPLEASKVVVVCPGVLLCVGASVEAVVLPGAQASGGMLMTSPGNMLWLMLSQELKLAICWAVTQNFLAMRTRMSPLWTVYCCAPATGALVLPVVAPVPLPAPAPVPVPVSGG